MDKGLLLRMFLLPIVGIGCGIVSNYLPDWANAAALTVAVLLVLERVMEWRDARNDEGKDD